LLLMKLYKHYSFDLWMTLIKSHPEFKRHRALYFFKQYNSLQKTVEEVESSFKKVDYTCNAVNEKTGKNIDADEMYWMVIHELNNGLQHFTQIDFNTIYKDIETLFFNYLPVLYNNETITHLEKIKNKSGATFNLLSNTAFIKGSTLRKAIMQIGLSTYFDFDLYSDEEGVSKPNAKIFETMITAVAGLHKKSTITVQDIIHVGDNANADIEGAKRAGINYMLVNSNQVGIQNLLP
jgi:putative hydrolase of the HAD superfamily